eukprot:XP_004917258.1 PREDICTED: uncharacterized protein LOC101730890 [Xenopus tropicalis]
MSECKGDSSGATKEETERGSLPPSVDLMGKVDGSTKSSKGYSAIVFLGKGKEKKYGHNLSKDLKENEKKKPLVNSSVTKKCEALCFEEASNEFTCSSSITESYQLSTNKEAKYCFRKLDDGTYAMEKIEELNPDESMPRKKSTKRGQQKGRYSHKPLKICFKKRSKALRKTSDSNDDYKSENKKVNYTNQYEAHTSVLENQYEFTQRGKTWATFKRLVTHKKKRHSSLKQQSQMNSQNHETNSNNSVSKKKRFSNIRLSCMNFSRGKEGATSSMPPQDALCAAESQEYEYDCKRSDKALAIKYKLQRSLDAENGKIDSNIDQCMYMPTDEFQSLPKLKRVMNHLTQGADKRNLHKSLRKTNVESVRSSVLEEREAPGLSGSSKEGIKPKAETPEGGNMHESYKNNLNDCDDRLRHDDDAISRSPLISDPYETLLITTAATLVKKVLQASIQQLVDEGSMFQ